MQQQQQATGRVRIGAKQALSMLIPYARARLAEQVKAVALIIVYLILFQTLVLGIAIAEGTTIAIGLALVICGLAFFMEGLVLGLMPLGETIGLKLPQKASLPVILLFAFVLGIGATFAEPAISVLRAAGSSVKAWEAPLLFLLLNKQAGLLVGAVGVGVGIAVLCGMVRFIYNLSLKPFIYALVLLLIVFTLWAFFNPNLRSITGLAWDCGGVTTGPVTVPLVLALGIGICRVIGSGSSGSAGFGVVTLASLFPIIAVLALGTFLGTQVPPPMSESDFFNPSNRSKVAALFHTEDELIGYAFLNATTASQLQLFNGNKAEMLAYLTALGKDSVRRKRAFGDEEGSFERWVALSGTPEQRAAVFQNEAALRDALRRAANVSPPINSSDLLLRNAVAALQAIVPLSALFLLVLVFLLRDRLPRADEVFLGLAFAIFGMMLFNIGIELGLSKLGNQVGGKVPSCFRAIPLPEQTRTINDFDPAIIATAITPEGEKTRFFTLKLPEGYQNLPYDPQQHNVETRQYTFVPRRGPLFGAEGGLGGIFVVLLFAFLLGYGATLAEPALNALGLTVEELTVGAFRKSLLMQAVALGVGLGIALGVAKIIWGIPLVWLLAPPYLALIYLSKISTEEFVNIGWDSAGVTTGPITVPLVLAMGLGIGGQVGVVEGFGILSMASVCPILSVLAVGLAVTSRRRADSTESAMRGVA